MTNVNKTLYIPLYGKSFVSKKGIILHDETAEKIWADVAIPLKGKSRSKWLAYNMAMRARVFDDWTNEMLVQHPQAIVLHIGCGLDSRCRRIKQPFTQWLDCDFPDVIEARKSYYSETEHYKMTTLNAAEPETVKTLPDSDTAIIVFEGISMYLTHSQLHDFFQALQNKYRKLHILMDVYTEFGAKASKYKNPINDVGVTKVYGIDNVQDILSGLKIRLKAEHSFTPPKLVNELKGAERFFFRMLFTGNMYKKIYSLY
ncbi:MAG: class I SAM-dependent methyltransferase [Spirochaetales bacterium]|nr:class I SAM-dependent methyltransferase [Spirochaetales bacterium]